MRAHARFGATSEAEAARAKGLVKGESSCAVPRIARPDSPDSPDSATDSMCRCRHQVVVPEDRFYHCTTALACLFSFGIFLATVILYLGSFNTALAEYLALAPATCRVRCVVCTGAHPSLAAGHASQPLLSRRFTRCSSRPI